MSQDLYRPEATAERLDISRAQVYNLIKSGELRSIKIGRARRIPAAAIDEFIQARMPAQSTA